MAISWAAEGFYYHERKGVTGFSRLRQQPPKILAEAMQHTGLDLADPGGRSPEFRGDVRGGLVLHHHSHHDLPFHLRALDPDPFHRGLRLQLFGLYVGGGLGQPLVGLGQQDAIGVAATNGLLGCLAPPEQVRNGVTGDLEQPAAKGFVGKAAQPTVDGQEDLLKDIFLVG
ncbi:MAG: hypothetical protein L0Z62_17400 [Gemmataceae bacterium]|nr:hypothetical protein [Gemmataceae bacterium]